MVDLALSLVAAAAGFAAIQLGWRAAPSGLARRHWLPVAVLAAAAGVVAALASGEPTGHALTDVVLRALLGAAVTAVASRARRPSLIVSATLAAASSPGDAVVMVLAFLVLGAAVGVAVSGYRSRIINGTIGGVVVNVVLRLEWPEQRLATAVVAALAIGILVLSGVRRFRRRNRRRAFLIAALVGLGAIGAVGAYGASALRARHDLQAAVGATERGITLARSGESEEAHRSFDRALTRLRTSDRRLSRWWTRPVRHVPFAAQQVRAVDGVITTATAVVERAATALRVADVDRIRPQDGQIDLAALTSFEAPLAAAIASLQDVSEEVDDIRSPWLVPQLDEQLDEVDGRAFRAARDSTRILEAVESVPWLLGQGGQRRWFLAVAQPSELRGGGGFIGNWGILTATDGRIELPTFGRIRELYRDQPYGVSVGLEYDARYLHRFGLQQWPQNLLSSPHLPSSAEAIRDVAEATGHGPIDGVIVVDPHGVAALLQLTGPITVPGWPEPLTAENAARVLLHEQYLDAESEGREQFLADTTRTLFDRLTAGELPSPTRIADVLGPAIDQHRIQLYAFDRDARGFIHRLGADATLARPVVDSLGVVAHNAEPSKLDWFLRRSTTYDLSVDEQTGDASGTIEVRLRNLAPKGLPANGYLGSEALGVGTMELMVSLYTPLDLVGLRVGDTEVEPDVSAEQGHRVYDTFVRLLPGGGEMTLRYEVRGRLRMHGGRYRLDVHRQPTVAPDGLVVQVNGQTLFDGVHDTDVAVHTQL